MTVSIDKPPRWLSCLTDSIAVVCAICALASAAIVAIKCVGRGYPAEIVLSFDDASAVFVGWWCVALFGICCFWLGARTSSRILSRDRESAAAKGGEQ